MTSITASWRRLQGRGVDRPATLVDRIAAAMSNRCLAVASDSVGGAQTEPQRDSIQVDRQDRVRRPSNTDAATEQMDGAESVGRDLVGGNLAGIDFHGKNLAGTNLRDANLMDANLSGADLTGAMLVNANLVFVNLNLAELGGADLSRTRLSYADLTRAKLTGADLSGAFLRDANFTEADLSHARLVGAHLTRTNLTRARLNDAALVDADLTGADLTDADLTGADLTGANFALVRHSLKTVWPTGFAPPEGPETEPEVRKPNRPELIWHGGRASDQREGELVSAQHDREDELVSPQHARKDGFAVHRVAVSYVLFGTYALAFMASIAGLFAASLFESPPWLIVSVVSAILVVVEYWSVRLLDRRRRRRER